MGQFLSPLFFLLFVCFFIMQCGFGFHTSRVIPGTFGSSSFLCYSFYEIRGIFRLYDQLIEILYFLTSQSFLSSLLYNANHKVFFFRQILGPIIILYDFLFHLLETTTMIGINGTRCSRFFVTFFTTCRFCRFWHEYYGTIAAGFLGCIMHFNNSKVSLKLTYQSGYPIIQILIRHLHCMEDVLCLQTGLDFFHTGQMRFWYKILVDFKFLTSFSHFLFFLVCFVFYFVS